MVLPFLLGGGALVLLSLRSSEADESENPLELLSQGERWLRCHRRMTQEAERTRTFLH